MGAHALMRGSEAVDLDPGRVLGARGQIEPSDTFALLAQELKGLPIRRARRNARSMPASPAVSSKAAICMMSDRLAGTKSSRRAKPPTQKLIAGELLTRKMPDPFPFHRCDR